MRELKMWFLPLFMLFSGANARREREARSARMERHRAWYVRKFNLVTEGTDLCACGRLEASRARWQEEEEELDLELAEDEAHSKMLAEKTKELLQLMAEKGLNKVNK